ncbi:hypothetical protein WJX72_007339 [[Myrmecia] bisecta]|uniref:Xaa-Pro aminopeptidase P n=1 Tax=[Myrmecia] bisecta TaxID=41462 RepID=A0AAW1PCR5_9CHLO
MTSCAHCLVNRWPGSVASPRGLILFGGDSDAACTRFDDVWFLDIDTAAQGKHEWKELKASGGQPEKRSNCCAVVHSNKLVVFGGWQWTGTTPLAHLQVLDLATLTWQAQDQPKITGRAPSPRGQPAAVVTTGDAGRSPEMVIFGGWDGQQRFDDMYALDLRAWSWRQIQPAGGLSPPRRADHTALLWRYCDDGVWKDLIVCFGGSGDSGTLNDVWLYDMRWNRWTEAFCAGTPPAPRSSHAAAIVGDLMIIFGGQSRTHVFGDLHVLQLVSLTWVQVEVADLPALCRSAIAISDGMVWGFGGFDGARPVNTTFSIPLAPILASHPVNAVNLNKRPPVLLKQSVQSAGPAKPLGSACLRSVCAASMVAGATEPQQTHADAPAADERVAALRREMAEADDGAGVHAYIIPSEDPHMSEYPPDCDDRRRFISHFTGSAGTAVVTTEQAALWTDGRYFLQAEKQLGPGWTLMKAGTPKCPEIPNWLADAVPEGGRVGIDPFLHTVDSARKLQTKLEAAGRHLIPLLEGNLVDHIWGPERPGAPQAPIRVHKLEHAGESVADKLKRMRKQMEEAKAGALLVTALDEVAWLLNLRGGDISHNPVFLSYVILTPDAATLYVDSKKVNKEVAAHLDEASVAVKAYPDVLADVRALGAAGTKIWADPSKVSFALVTAAKEGAAGTSPAQAGAKRSRTEAEPAPAAQARRDAALFVEKPSPVTLAKAVKNPAELDGMREAHLRDSVALAKTFMWIEQQVAAGRSLNEVDVDDYLTGLRREQPGFIEPSFPTIAGANANGAIIHYRAASGTCNPIDQDTLLLVDSGGQYDCGTTDVTRTFHLGTPTQHQKMCFTRVLQGHIALDQAVFPEGTPGLALDTLARVPLWTLGLNYRHGTGHGVGAALNVHEGPQSISTRYFITTPLEAGMVVSNEPGYYEDGAFGIRVENLLVVREAATEFQFGGKYLAFERLTMCPLQRQMIALEVMSDREIQWVNDYHKEVWEKASPRMSGPELDWLKKHTAPLTVNRPTAVAA